MVLPLDGSARYTVTLTRKEQCGGSYTTDLSSPLNDQVEMLSNRIAAAEGGTEVEEQTSTTQR